MICMRALMFRFDKYAKRNCVSAAVLWKADTISKCYFKQMKNIFEDLFHSTVDLV